MPRLYIANQKIDTFIKVSKGAKIRNRYDQVPHLTQDTNGEVTNSQQTLILIRFFSSENVFCLICLLHFFKCTPD